MKLASYIKLYQNLYFQYTLYFLNLYLQFSLVILGLRYCVFGDLVCILQEIIFISKKRKFDFTKHFL